MGFKYYITKLKNIAECNDDYELDFNQIADIIEEAL